MSDEFKAEVFQNQFLPLGAGEVHAIMTVTAGQSMGSQTSGRLFGILCDVSGSMEGVKILAARAAMTRLVTMLPEDCSFLHRERFGYRQDHRSRGAGHRNQ